MSGEENKEAGGDAGVRVAREGPGGRRAGRAGGAERGGTAGDQSVLLCVSEGGGYPAIAKRPQHVSGLTNQCV